VTRIRTFSMQMAKQHVSTGMDAVMTWFMLRDRYTSDELLKETLTAVNTPVAT